MAQRGRAGFCVSFSSFCVFVIFVHVMSYLCNHINHLSYTSKISLLQLPPRSVRPSHLCMAIYVFPIYRARGERGHIGFGHSPRTNIFDCSLAPGKPQRSLLFDKVFMGQLGVLSNVQTVIGSSHGYALFSCVCQLLFTFALQCQ